MQIALLTQRESTDKHGAAIDILETSYTKFVHEIGFFPLSISNDCTALETLFEEANIGLIVLTGGGSLRNAYYDRSYSYAEQPSRDILEENLVQLAIKHNIPILAICRGMQFINGFLGGKTSKLDCLKVPRPIGADHKVKNMLTGATLRVNNYHNDGILIENLTPRAEILYADEENRIVEAFTIKEAKIIALQWHPERNFEDITSKVQTKKLILNFLEEIK